MSRASAVTAPDPDRGKEESDGEVTLTPFEQYLRPCDSAALAAPLRATHPLTQLGAPTPGQGRVEPMAVAVSSPDQIAKQLKLTEVEVRGTHAQPNEAQAHAPHPAALIRSPPAPPAPAAPAARTTRAAPRVVGGGV